MSKPQNTKQSGGSVPPLVSSNNTRIQGWHLCEVSDQRGRWAMERVLLWHEGAWKISKGNPYTTDENDEPWIVRSKGLMVLANASLSHGDESER